ncbi:hypothetical protein C7S14_4256 [Burkholderia cepacia]|nr:hypothetical protein C7S14_4256 [Burkholderia cepacia]
MNPAGRAAGRRTGEAGRVGRSASRQVGKSANRQTGKPAVRRLVTARASLRQSTNSPVGS